MNTKVKNNIPPGEGIEQAEAGVIRTLLYFDIFNYPLTLDELIKFHPYKNTAARITEAVSHLRNNMVIFRDEDFYSVQPATGFTQRRKLGNALARKRLQTARKFSGLISKFPFVRAIMLSGSLSKNYMENDSDIDYFIITEPGRLWLTRGLLALFKRVFLLNSHKFFCTNYLIDSESLEIGEKNIYTAMETTTLIPVYGKKLCEEFIDKNQWTLQYLPNAGRLQQTNFIIENQNLIKHLLERLLSGSMGEKLDLYCMNTATQRWKKKFKSSFTAAEFELAFKSGRNVSKNHPRFFQKKILNIFREKIEQFEELNKMKLSA